MPNPQARVYQRSHGQLQTNRTAMMADHAIFIVDDDDAVRDSLKILLDLRYPNVRTFESCREFLDSYDHNEGARPNCLILDIHLADMTGFDLLERLAEDGRHIPTILITGRNDAAIKARAAELGAVALLDKPLDHEKLIAALESIRAE